MASQSFRSEEYSTRSVRLALLSCGSQAFKTTLLHGPSVCTLPVIENRDATSHGVKLLLSLGTINFEKAFYYTAYFLFFCTITFNSGPRRNYCRLRNTFGSRNVQCNQAGVNSTECTLTRQGSSDLNWNHLYFKRGALPQLRVLPAQFFQDTPQLGQSLLRESFS